VLDRYCLVQPLAMRITHKRYLHLLICAGTAALLQSAALAQTPAATSPATLSITLPEALAAASKNLDAQIATLQITGARADVLAANRAPLPTLSTSVSQIDLQNGIGAGSVIGDKRIDKNIGIDWMWERGNKRELRTRAANEAVNASLQDLSETLIQQKLLVSNAFFDLFAAQERIRQVGAIAESANQLAAVASKRLAAGDVSAQDAARSSIEAQRAQNDILVSEQDRARAELTLRLVMGSGSQKLTAISSSVPTSIAPQAISSMASSTSSTVEARPDVQAALARTLAAKAQLDNALALKTSDITLGTAFDHFPGTSNRLLTFRMQMPLQLGGLGGHGFQGEIAKAETQLAITEAALDKARRAATSDAQRLAQELTSSQTRAKNYSAGIAPEAKRVADLAELAYSKGALSLTDLLEARRTWRATTLEAIAAQTDFERAQSAWSIRHEQK
jgi:cobalt-zinc-cadmium efflux system outer membrane protein